MDKKLIFLDIDGTLTPAGSNDAPDSAVEAIKKARENGHIVFICTGRNKGMLSPVLRYGFDGYIGSAGGYVVCGDEVIYDYPMPADEREGLMECLRSDGVFLTIEGVEDSFTDDSFKEFLEENANEGGNSELLRWRRQLESSLNIQSMTAYKKQDIYKIIFMCQEESQIQKALEEYEDKYLFCIQERDKYGIINGELINRNFDKGQAVKRVCEHLGFDLKNTIAFGDSMNDREMMETAGLSICMGNGCDTLKALSDEVCEAVDQDGLAKAFREHGLI